MSGGEPAPPSQAEEPPRVGDADSDQDQGVDEVVIEGQGCCRATNPAGTC